MLIRTISGAVFVAIICGFFCLRQFVCVQAFNVLILFLCTFGTFEIARAVKEKSNKTIFIVDIIYGILFVPLFYLTRYFLSVKNAILICGCLALFSAFIVLFVYKISTQGKSLKINFIYLVLPLIYPSILLLSMLVLNGLGKGFIGLLLVFVISPLSDTFAYLVGMTYQKIKKGNAKKLCPNLSPKKTVAGAIGGLVGGVIGGILVWLIFRPNFSTMPSVLLLSIIGFVGSIATEIGDLFESLIKRKVGIKDMGKIMPGHGGVMDRIDGILFCSAVVFIFLFFIR